MDLSEKDGLIPMELPIRSAGAVLDRLAPGDAAAFRRIVTIPAVGRMLFIFPADYSEAQAAALIARDCDPGQRPMRLAIRWPGTGDLIGAIGLGAGPAPDIYYFLDPAFAGQGIMQAAVAAFVRAVEAQFGLRVLGAKVFTDNPASARVLEVNGFQHVGEDMVKSAQRDAPALVWIFRRDPHAPLE